MSSPAFDHAQGVSVIGLFRKLLRARRGNVAIGFAILLPVLISAVGGAVDFAFVTSERSQLQDALDAASVGAVATNSAAYKAAAAMTVDGPVVLGVTNATSIFNANVANVSGLQNIQFSVSVLKSGVKITSTVSATGTYKTAFLGLAGISSMPNRCHLHVQQQHAELSGFLPAAGRFGIDGASLHQLGADPPRGYRPR